MTKNKKGSSNQPLPITEHTVVVKEKSSSGSAKKIGNEIDEIFAGKKRKRVENNNKSEKSKNVTPSATVPNKTVKKQKKKEDGDTGKGNRSSEKVSQSKKKKKTGDGLVIYTEEELGIGKADAGGTRLCPFDCDCCF